MDFVNVKSVNIYRFPIYKNFNNVISVVVYSGDPKISFSASDYVDIT